MFLRICLNLSYLFGHGYFLICLMYMSQSASFSFSFKGNCSACSAFIMFMEKGKLGARYVAILVNPPSPMTLEPLLNTSSNKISKFFFCKKRMQTPKLKYFRESHSHLGNLYYILNLYNCTYIGRNYLMMGN